MSTVMHETPYDAEGKQDVLAYLSKKVIALAYLSEWVIVLAYLSERVIVSRVGMRIVDSTLVGVEVC
jgi:hypothetical protein